ncbi:GGDEF domain-containing response regulator [Leptothoe spongobia]|uniref:Diguanylate cyclase n=1 Tax=Leptothoe spongobia TAU-MAC 1115 TaxID=1967444 RepID=A0A947GR60_9CYAN|nr:diguanylate cyclase [Leptothoe spongobia]MBT9317366.1 diguanylate cyclase [Leptothoe spongobia TAU-MAC 1115]
MGSTNILLIEDNPGDVFLINTFLEKAEKGQFNVTHVDSLGSAVTCLQQTHFDIALLDLSLPDSHGLDTLLRLQAKAPNLPTVVLTRVDDAALAVHLMQHGAQDYLVKGKINQNWLNSTILHAITRFQKTEAIFETERQYKQELIRRLHTYEKKITCMDGKLKILETLSFTDGLTEIPNRYYFEVAFKKNWLQACRYQQPLSLIMIDLDYFKRLNDSRGHLAGDRCLRQIAQTLKEALAPSGGVITRYGGEEFAVILPDSPVQTAVAVARTLGLEIKYLSIRHPNSAVSSWVTASFGVASVVPTSQISSKDLIYKADRALYVAKENGRDRISYFQQSSFFIQSIDSKVGFTDS